jgi:diguanylate cyclase (GGDEF)-like protein/PAS domain S-box-containing protein
MQLQPEFPQARRLGPVRILLLEDDPAFAGLVLESLRRASTDELALSHVASLAEAQARLAGESFDLILTDLSLPDSKGLDTLGALVGPGDRLICVLTGDQDEGLREAALALGAYDLLSKDRLAGDTLDRLVRLAVMQARALATARRGEARLRAIVEAEPECVKLLDADARLIEMNPAGLRMIEAESLAVVRGHCVLDLVSEGHREAFAAVTRRASQGQPGTLEFEVVGLKGGRRWLETHAVPLREEGGEPALVLGITRDITARKNAEAGKERLDRTYQALAQANEAILKANTEEELFDRACEIAVEVGGFVLGAVLRLGPDGWLTRAAAKGMGASITAQRPSVDPARPEGRGLAGEACRTRRPVISNDFATDRRVGVFRQAIPYEVGAVAIFPLFADGEVAGVFVLRHAAPGAFTPELAMLLERVAGNISFALTSFRREAARVQEERLRGLEHSVARELSGAKSPGEALQAVLRAICETGRFDCGRYFHLDDASGTMRLREGWAADAQVAPFVAASRELRFSPGLGLVGLVWKTGELLWSADATSDPRVAMKGLAASVGLHGTLVVPVSFEGRVIGVLSLATRRPFEADARLIETMQVTGTQMGQYLQRKQREAALDRFRAALDGSADMVLLVDIRDGAKLVDFNETACYLLGYGREELLGRPSSLIVADLSEAELRVTHAALLARHGRTDLVVRTFRRKDGSTFEVEVLRKVVDSPEGPILVLNARDLTERRRIEERQAAHLRYQESTARLGQSALGRRDAAGLVNDALQTLKESIGCDEVGYQDRLPEGWKAGHASALAEPVHGEAGERGVIFALSAKPDQFGPEEGRFLAATASVLSAGLLRIDSEARLAFLAQFDGLTGLPNRALLRDRFSQLIVQARRHESALGLLFIDLDDFKMVNDTLGHAGGDELLKEVAGRLLAAVRPGDTVARIAGDEFAVILGDLARAEDAALVAQKVIDRLSGPLSIGGQEAFVTASIGIAAFPADGNDAESLLAAADAAMYRAKQAGRNGYQFFTAEINQRTRARAQLGSELRRALERDEFELVYQAKYDLRSGAPCAAEALLRWRHPERGLVTPGEFIPVLEETGLIVPVGERVLRRACADLQAWRAAGLPALPVAVNLSARQFRQQDLHSRLLEQVRASGVEPRLIELEITESQLMHDPDHAQRVLRSLAEAGIRVAIDDFGTGYSSLSYLTRFPVSALKIDRSFVADVLHDHADAAIVRAIIDMAHTLGFLVVAEGVETQAQATLLRSLGCEQAQGYYFSRPMAEAAFRQLLADAKPRQESGPARGR